MYKPRVQKESLRPEKLPHLPQIPDWRLISGDLRSLSGDDRSMLVDFRSIEIASKNKEGEFEKAVLFLSTAVRSEVAYRSAEKSPDAAI